MKIGACEYKDIAADCYKRNVPSFGIIQELNVFNKIKTLKLLLEGRKLII
jgi:hypothetical protein